METDQTNFPFWLSSLVIISPFVVAFLLFLIFKASFYNYFFRRVVVQIISIFLLNRLRYRVLDNLELPSTEGSEIVDQVIVSKYGLFVVNINRMKGWIYASSNQRDWTHVIYKYKKSLSTPLHQSYSFSQIVHKYKNKFPNPLLQNEGNIKILSELIGIDQGNIYSVVTFIGDVTFKAKRPENVYYSIGYINYIRSKKKQVFSNKEVKAIVAKLKNGQFEGETDVEVNQSDSLEQKTKEKRNNEKKICPACENSMVIRKAMKGKYAGSSFWVCSQAPKCRKVLPISKS